MAFGEPVRIQLAGATFHAAEAPALSARAVGMTALAPPPGLEPAAADTTLTEQLLALQRQRLLLQNYMLSQAHARTMQMLAYQSMCRAPEAKASARLSTSSASTASGDASSEASEEPLTTVIVKKVPKAFSRDMLLELLDKRGFRGTYDFIYMPVDFEKNLGTGCCFINFTGTEAAEAFKRQFQGFRSWGVRCSNTKKAEVTWSQTCQGRQAHVERYRDSPVMHPSVPDGSKPALFESGARVEFPPPRRALKAPGQSQHLAA